MNLHIFLSMFFSDFHIQILIDIGKIIKYYIEWGTHRSLPFRMSY